MNAGWQAYDGALRWVERPQLDPLPGDWARLQLEWGGVCGTDRQILAGYAGFRGYLGHEFCARVIECAQPGWLGERVVGAINVGCGGCGECAGGDQRFCPHRRVLGIRGLDGAFARSFALPLSNLVPVGAMDGALACWAEPLAAALEAGRALTPGEEVLVLGDGRLGALTALALRGRHPVTLLGKHPAKIERLRALGLDARLHLPEGRLWPALVEATGSPAGLSQALELCAPRGTVVVKSTVAQPEALSWTPLVLKALRLQGSRCGPLPPALEALRSGQVDPRPLVDRIFPLEELPAALAEMAGGCFKVLLSGPACSNGGAENR